MYVYSFLLCIKSVNFISYHVWIHETEQSDCVQFEVVSCNLLLFLEAKHTSSSSRDVEGEPSELKVCSSW